MPYATWKIKSIMKKRKKKKYQNPWATRGPLFGIKASFKVRFYNILLILILKKKENVKLSLKGRLNYSQCMGFSITVHHGNGWERLRICQSLNHVIGCHCEVDLRISKKGKNIRDQGSRSRCQFNEFYEPLNLLLTSTDCYLCIWSSDSLDSLDSLSWTEWMNIKKTASYLPAYHLVYHFQSIIHLMFGRRLNHAHHSN